jgi:hypothetical protein
MASPRAPQPVKLFVGMLSSDPDLLRRARQLLTRTHGPAEFDSELWPFNQTDYYDAEMGPDLKRTFVVFERLARPDDLPEIKIGTNALEAHLADEALSAVPRPVNLDPGYLDLNKLVLASTKDASHRLYLGRGIFGEVTLRYTEGGWQLLPWTYPDFREPHYHAFFTQVRERYKAQRRDLLAAEPEEPAQ